MFWWRRSLIRVISREGGSSSGWSLRIVFHQGGLSSGWYFIRVVFHQRGLSSGWYFIMVVYCQDGLLSGMFFLSSTVFVWATLKMQIESNSCTPVESAVAVVSKWVFFSLQMYTYWTFLVVLLDSLWQSAVIYFLPHLVSTDTCSHMHACTLTHLHLCKHSNTHTHTLSLSPTHSYKHPHAHTLTHTYITHTFYFCLSFTSISVRAKFMLLIHDRNELSFE